MSSNMTAEEIREEHLLKMGAQIGTLYSALYIEVVDIHVKWNQYRLLYADSADRTNLLNDSAGFFFGMIQSVLFDDIVLHIARLTDREKSRGKDNLTVVQLPILIDKPRAIADDIQTAVEGAITAAQFSRDHRNRRLAHSDLKIAFGDASVDPLQPATIDAVDHSLTTLRDILNRVSVHFLKTEVAFDQPILSRDAGSLVSALRTARKAQIDRMARFRDGRDIPEDSIPE